MHYQAHYDKLIAKARSRVIEGYVERHHIIPVCLGGSDDKANIVDLTAAEHYVAHLLLAKIHSSDHRLTYAVIAMSAKNKHHVGRSANKIYAWLRKTCAEHMSVKMIGNTYNKGKTQSEEVKQKRGIFNPKSEEHRQKIGAGNTGKTKGVPRGPQSPEHLAKRMASKARTIALRKGELSS